MSSKKPAAKKAAPAKAKKAEGYRPGQAVHFHQALAPWALDEYRQLEEEAKARGQKLPERGSFTLRPATIADGPSKKGQYLLRMVDDASELVCSPGVRAGEFS